MIILKVQFRVHYDNEQFLHGDKKLPIQQTQDTHVAVNRLFMTSHFEHEGYKDNCMIGGLNFSPLTLGLCPTKLSCLTL